MDDLIDPKNIKFKAEFAEAKNGGQRLRIIFDSLEYNFSCLRSEIRNQNHTLSQHLENHRLRDERMDAIKSVAFKGGAVLLGAVTVAIGFLGLIL